MRASRLYILAACFCFGFVLATIVLLFVGP